MSAALVAPRSPGSPALRGRRAYIDPAAGSRGRGANEQGGRIPLYKKAPAAGGSERSAYGVRRVTLRGLLVAPVAS